MDARVAQPAYHDHFWPGFGPHAPASLKGLAVLEIGCGAGARSIEMADQGAIVTGIDPYEGTAPVTLERPGLTFRCCPLSHVAEQFDAIVSENAFEHIADVPAALADIRERLKPGCRAYIGFGPLFHAPYGDHTFMQRHLPFRGLPWSHLYLPRRLAYRLIGRQLGCEIRDTVDWPYLVLNQLTVRQFRELFAQSGMKVVTIRQATHRSFAGCLLDALARLPMLETYLSAGLYVVLETVD